MQKKIFEDSDGDVSSKRVFGAIIIVFSMLQSTFDGFNMYSVNETLVIAQFGIGATLLGLDSITGIWKGKKNESI